MQQQTLTPPQSVGDVSPPLEEDSDVEYVGTFQTHDDHSSDDDAHIELIDAYESRRLVRAVPRRGTGVARNQRMRKGRDEITHAVHGHAESDDPAESSTSLQTANVSPGLLNLSQMLSAFLSEYFPSNESMTDLRARKSYLLALPDLRLETSPVLRHALGTVCSVYLGSRFNDQRLLEQSKKEYGRTLTALVRQMQGKLDTPTTMAMLASIMLLTLYDEAIPSPQSDLHGWQAHYDGAFALLKAKGPACVDPTDPFGRVAFINLRQPAVWTALARRKPIVLGESEWLLLQPEKNSRNGHFFGFLMANIVAKTERLCLEPSRHEDVLQHWMTILQFKKEISEWLGAPLQAGGLGFYLEASLQYVSDLSGFDIEIEEHCFMTTNSTFLSFPTISNEHSNQSWFLKVVVVHEETLIADCALLRLLHFHPWLARHIDVHAHREIQQSAFTAATSLCRLLYALSKWHSQGFAAFVLTMCKLAQNFFEEVGAVREVGWCQGVSSATRLRIARMRLAQPRTPCRMEDLYDAISGLSRFRALDVSVRPNCGRIGDQCAHLPARGCPFSSERGWAPG